MVHGLVRLVRVALGLVLGLFVASAIVLVIDLNKGHLPDLLAGLGAAGLVAFQAAKLIWPVAILALAAEVLRWRSLLLYLAAGFALGAATLAYAWLAAPTEPPDPILGEEPVLTTATIIAALAGGLAGGLVYWFAAGRSAGFSASQRPIP